MKSQALLCSAKIRNKFGEISWNEIDFCKLVFKWFKLTENVEFVENLLINRWNWKSNFRKFHFSIAYHCAIAENKQTFTTQQSTKQEARFEKYSENLQNSLIFIEIPVR